VKTFIASLSTETNSFSPLPTGRLSFEEAGIAHGDATKRPMEYWTGPMHIWRARAEARGWPVVESLTAHAQPAGPTVRPVYEEFRDEILRDLEAAMPVDIVLLSLHGAMIAGGYDDCEGDLIARCRVIAGPKAIIGGLLDPHCHLTEAMLTEATLLVAYKEYPHVDIPARAEDLFRLAADAAEGRTRPVMRDRDCRMICAMHTPYEPMRGFVDRMVARESAPGILSLSLAHGFPWGDHPRVGARALAITDGDAGLAQRVAGELAEELFSLRHGIMRPYPDIDGALDRAAMRELVFRDAGARQRLEAIVHPLVSAETERQARQALDAGHALLVFDVPLLVESLARWREKVDRIVVVDCEPDTQIARVMARNQLPRAQIEGILAAQATRAQRLAAADAVLFNGQATTLAALGRQVDGLAASFGL